MWRPTKSRIECKNVLRAYLDTKGKNYEESALEYLEENIMSSLGEEEIPDILMQIYNELGLYYPSRSPYVGYFNKLLSIHGLDKDILDVGGGHLPTFGHMIAKYQLRIGKGTISVIDPALITNKSKMPNLKLIKEEFNKEYDITNYDMLVGILPCDTTEDLIESAIVNHKDFFVGMCGCIHGELRSMYFGGGMYWGFNPTPVMYQNLVEEKAQKLLEEYSEDELGITYLSKKHMIPFPILYNKKRNTK